MMMNEWVRIYYQSIENQNELSPNVEGLRMSHCEMGFIIWTNDVDDDVVVLLMIESCSGT